MAETVEAKKQLRGESLMKQPSIFSEYFQFLKEEKKYWMIPIVFLFLAIGTLVVLLESSVLTSFIYAIF